MKKQTKLTAKIAEQVIASQTKVAAAALQQMKVAEAAGNMQVAVVAAQKLIAAAHAAACISTTIPEYQSMMEKLGCTVGEREGIKFYNLPISEAVSDAMAARHGKK